MATLIQLLCWLLFGFIGYKTAEKLNRDHNTNFDSKIWAAIGFLFGFIGICGLCGYAYFKLRKDNK